MQFASVRPWQADAAFFGSALAAGTLAVAGADAGVLATGAFVTGGLAVAVPAGAAGAVPCANAVDATKPSASDAAATILREVLITTFVSRG